jgi:hypothetical protein
MSRLIAFGDSQTFGHGLPDCWNEKKRQPGPEPSKFAWPNFLAKLLSVNELVHTSYTCAPGASNLEILYKILCFDFKPNDIVVIFWSFTSRDLILTEDYTTKTPAGDFNYLKEKIRIGNWLDNEKNREWFSLHTKADYMLRSWFIIHHAENYLNNIGLENYNVLSEFKHMIKKENFPSYLNFKNVDLKQDYSYFYKINEKALDGKHGNIKCNEDIANCMYYNFILKSREQKSVS